MSAVHQRLGRAGWILFLAAVLMFSLGCNNYVARGRYLYREGRYIESAEVLARHEQDLPVESPRKQVEYATYRGLSMLVLGNYQEAQRWLQFAYDIERTRPGSLRPALQQDLDRGWEQLQLRMQAVSPLRVHSSAANLH